MYTPFFFISYLIETLLKHDFLVCRFSSKVCGNAEKCYRKHWHRKDWSLDFKNQDQTKINQKIYILYAALVYLLAYIQHIYWPNIIWQRCNPAVFMCGFLCTCVLTGLCLQHCETDSETSLYCSMIIFLQCVILSLSSPFCFSHRAINTLTCSLTSVEGHTGWERWRGLAKS